MRIEELKPSQRKKGRFLVKLEDGSILRVTETELLHYHLTPGAELDEETLENLSADARQSSAKATAASIISNRALSKQELMDRLIKKGTSAIDAQKAVDWLEDIGALDDGEYAAIVVHFYAQRGYGPRRVREELYRRGVDRSLWDDALEKLPDPAETLDAIIQKKSQGVDLYDRREMKRISDFLLRRGFRWNDIKDALRRCTELGEISPPAL